MMIHFFIVGRHGVLVSGCNHDFLGCILLAKQFKERFQTYLPESRLRVQLRYPNGKHVSSLDIKAALRALQSAKVCASVKNRLSQAADISAAHSEARTAEISAEPYLRFGANAASFCQASVVSPPDSLTNGNSVFDVFCSGG